MNLFTKRELKENLAKSKVSFLPKELEHINEYELIILGYRIFHNNERSDLIPYHELSRQSQEVDWNNKTNRHNKIMEVIKI